MLVVRVLLAAPVAMVGALVGAMVCAIVGVACTQAKPTARAPEGPPPDNQAMCTVASRGPERVRLLTRDEYDRTLRDLLGDTTAPARASFPAETGLTGYENDSAAHRATPTLVEQLLRVAEDVAHRARVERPERLMTCDVAVAGEAACGAALVDGLGPRAFRRPLDVEERARLLNLFETARVEHGYAQAIEMTVQAMLVSPPFLYRVDLGLSIGTDGEASLASPHEMASRLSYLLWGTMPDEELFAAAADQSLLDRAEVERQARRMLDDPRAKEGIGSFFRQWLALDRLNGIQKDAGLTAIESNRLASSWHGSVMAFVDDVVWGEGGTLLDLMTSDALFVDDTLAPIYDATASGGGAFARVRAPQGTRAGLLTQPGMMALLANADQSSPIRRGVWVREKLLCQPIDPPPPDVAIDPPPADPNLTTRERFAAHTSNESCRDCHTLIDPIGFGFERYDALGRYRDQENGFTIDDSGELMFTGDASVEGPFVGAFELGGKLARSRIVRECIADQLFTAALGRVPEPSDRCVQTAVSQALTVTTTSSGRFKDALIALATSDALRTVRGTP